MNDTEQMAKRVPYIVFSLEMAKQNSHEETKIREVANEGLGNIKKKTLDKIRLFWRVEISIISPFGIVFAIFRVFYNEPKQATPCK